MNFLNFAEKICGGEIPHLLVFDFSTAPRMLFYSYIPIIIITLMISTFILIKDKRSLQSKSLFVLSLFFVFWILNILVQWISSYHTVLMLGWQATAFFEVGIYLSAVFFSYVFFFQKNLKPYWQVILVSIMMIVAILTPTDLNIYNYDINNCEGNLGKLWSVIYTLEPASILLIMYLGFIKYKQEKGSHLKKKIALFTAGISIFLAIFFVSNFYAELTGFYEFNFWGPLGMVIFMGFLAYTIVKFRLFNLKIIGSNVFVLALWILMGSLLAIQDINLSHAVTAITLIISIIFGLILINSVRKEVAQREKIENLASDLKVANDRLLELDKQKSEFVSFATHQLRAPLTAMKGYSSLVLEGEYGDISPQVKTAMTRISDSSNTLANIVNDYLNISRIELGTMKYDFSILDLRKLIDDVIGELKPNIDKKGLKISFSTKPSDAHARFMVHADKDKMKQVITNLIDNSVKYTPSGSLDILLSKNIEDRKILFSLKDTGVGISPEVMPKLFAKFVRAENANKTNIYGTGLGLYIAKQIVNSHKGRIWAESLGDGKGSSFFMELDMEV